MIFSETFKEMCESSDRHKELEKRDLRQLFEGRQKLNSVIEDYDAVILGKLKDSVKDLINGSTPSLTLYEIYAEHAHQFGKLCTYDDIHRALKQLEQEGKIVRILTKYTLVRRSAMER